jgi:AcrR family transcriptional regulator
MSRTVDPARRDDLLNGAVEYAIEHGLSDLTLRPLADALGVMPNTLVYHFGSKEELLSAILNGVRDRLRDVYLKAQAGDRTHQQAIADIWAWSSDEQHTEFFRSFFEAYGLALRQPQRFGEFLERVVADWLPIDHLEQSTLELAVLRGLLLDLLTTGERERVNGALARFLEMREA